MAKKAKTAKTTRRGKKTGGPKKIHTKVPKDEQQSNPSSPPVVAEETTDDPPPDPDAHP